MEIPAVLEDYLRAIALLHERIRNVRVTDVADFLNVSKSGVSRAVISLRDARLVEHENYSHIVLTAQGKAYARALLLRHNVIQYFLEIVIGVDEQTAEMDACRMEHYLSRVTMEKLSCYLDTLPKEVRMHERVRVFQEGVRERLPETAQNET